MPQAAGAVAAGIFSTAASSLLSDDSDFDALGRRQLVPFQAGGLSARLQDGGIVVGPSRRKKITRNVITGHTPGSGLPPGHKLAGLRPRRPITEEVVSFVPDPQGLRRQRMVDRLSGVFGTQGRRLEGLLPKLRPGFSDFREAGLSAIGNRARRTVGNLRQNLADRRVLGSSFGQSAIDRTQREFAQEEAEFASQAFLQELDTTVQLIGSIGQARSNQVQAVLDEMNLQADIGLQLATDVQSQLGDNSRLKAELAFKAQQGRGALWQPAIDAVGGAFGDWIAGLNTGGGA